jgi:hypothetical protein
VRSSFLVLVSFDDTGRGKTQKMLAQKINGSPERKPREALINPVPVILISLSEREKECGKICYPRVTPK